MDYSRLHWLAARQLPMRVPMTISGVTVALGSGPGPLADRGSRFSRLTSEAARQRAGELRKA
jgi:hypothetical protein